MDEDEGLREYLASVEGDGDRDLFLAEEEGLDVGEGEGVLLGSTASCKGRQR